MNTYWRVLFTVLFVLGTHIGGVLPLAAQTPESDTTYVSEITGAVIDIGDSGEWEVVGSGFLPGDDDSDPSDWLSAYSDDSVISVQILDEHLTPAEWFDMSLENQAFNYNWADILGRDHTPTEGWLLKRGSGLLEFSRIGYFEFYTDETTGISVSVEIYSNEHAFLSDMDSVRSNVTVDGEYVFANADMQELEAMLNGTSAIEPIPMERGQSNVFDWRDKGLVSATTWFSDEFNTSVSWDNSALRFPFHRDFGIILEPEENLARLILQTPDFTGNLEVSLTVNQESRDLDDWLSHWESEEYLTESRYHYPSVDSRSGEDMVSIVFTRDAGFGNEVIAIRHAFFTPDGYLATINMEAAPANISRVYDETNGALVFNDEPLVTLWTFEEIEEMPSSGEHGSEAEATTEVTRTSRSAATSEASTSDNTMTGEAIDVTVDLGPTGDAVFYEDGHNVVEAGDYTLETFMFDYGTTVVIVDVMDGNVDIDEYMLNAEADIAATYDYMDWLGGDWSGESAWDVYSGAYKLDYRELVYLDLVQDPESGLYFGIGIYGPEANLPNDIQWLQENITIDGKGILPATDTDLVASVINGSSGFVAEPVPMDESTVSDWSNAGLVSETEWLSPTTNTSFSWDGESIVFPFAQSDALSDFDGVFTLELRTADRRGEVKLTSAQSDYALVDWVDSLTSPEYLEAQEAIGQPVTILDSYVSNETASVITLFHTDFDHPVIVIFDVYINDEGTTVVTEISAAPADIADVYSAVWDGVQYEGDYYPFTWTIEDIESLAVD